MKSKFSQIEGNGNYAVEQSRTDLDSHASILVVSRFSAILSYADKNSEVRPFAPDYESRNESHIVHAVIQCNFPYLEGIYILVVKNALHVPITCNSSLLPFIIKDIGICSKVSP